jgi:sporulation protein YlmC with PRC-barrel domain
MPTPSGHTRAIIASRVKDAAVYNASGEKIGHVEDIVLDKMSNQIMFAVLGFGGVLDMGKKYHPVPWSILDYDPQKGGYIVSLSKDSLEQAPTYSLDELTQNDGEVRQKAYNYYHVEPYWH